MNLILIPIIILIIALIPFSIATYKDANESMHQLNESIKKKKMHHI